MRWRFIDANNRQEAAERQAIIAKIDDWWREFQSKQADLCAAFAREVEWDLPGWMGRHLQAVHPRLMWEFGPAVHKNGHRLVITPEAAHHLRPLVRTLLQRAPELESWEFYDGRLAEGMELARLTVQARIGRELDGFVVKVARGDHQTIDLTYTSANVANADDRTAADAAFVATECLLGEAVLNDWIGAIEVAAVPPVRGLRRLFDSQEKRLKHFIELDRLPETVESLIGGIQEQLPPQPHYQWLSDGADWSLWQLAPEEADDYPNQQDIFVGKSANAPMWCAAHSGGLFTSKRFSRCGETFCYLKIDGSEGLEESSFDDKGEIEDALDQVLVPAGLGCHIGGGTGLRYSYIDLALTDVDRAITVIRQRLQAGNVPKRTWIQFFDTDLEAEWVGIYDDTPEPPLAVSLVGLSA